MGVDNIINCQSRSLDWLWDNISNVPLSSVCSSGEDVPSGEGGQVTRPRDFDIREEKDAWED